MKSLAWCAVGLLVLGCNTAPLNYQSDAFHSEGKAPWDHPTETACAERDTGGEVELYDGFSWCGRNAKMRPVDDPVLVSCDEAPSFDAATEIFFVFDGVVARAYPIQLLHGRELLHDQYGDVPVLVDW